jgi:radical SAM superfamily enzyme YgiQ (UPF0313 family)
MRVALIHGPIEGDFPPLGALTLSSLAKQKGISITLAALPDLAGCQSLAEEFKGFDLVGVSTDSSSYPFAILFAQTLRRLDPNARIVFGGPQATVTAPQTVEAFEAVDLVVKGEAEKSWPLLLDGVGRRDPGWRAVPGGVWREADRTRSVPEHPVLADVDEVPLPDYAALPWVRGLKAIPLEVGRGCPYGCTFCSTNTFFKRRFRMKSTPRIVADVQSLIEMFGVNHIDFVHDMFTVRRDFVVEISQAMKELPVSWNCSARTDRLDPELMQLMKSAGCTGVYAGLETGSQRLQPIIKKNLDVAEAMATVRRCQIEGLSVTTSLIMGYPNETRADLFETLLCIFELARPHPREGALGRVQPQLHLFSPLAGTPILDEANSYVFDGMVSNMVELGGGGGLPQAVCDLIAQYPEIFSAFYRPADTEVTRHHYFTLTRVMEHIIATPGLLAKLSQTPTEAFVAYLVAPGLERFGRDTALATFEAVWSGYLSRSRIFDTPFAPGAFSPTALSARR